MTEVTPIEDCQCDWFGPEGHTRPCGCEQEGVRLYRDWAIHWEGKHWRLWCLVQALHARLAQAATVLDHIESDLAFAVDVQRYSNPEAGWDAVAKARQAAFEFLNPKEETRP